MTTAGTEQAPHGIVVVDKPAGWTSHDVVARTRRLLGTRKVGHAGTLDPDATGVLVLGVGRATRLLRFVTEQRKSYIAEIVLGVETSTLDASGEVTARHDMARVSDDEVRSAAAALTGPIMQIPPMVSAVKVGGKRLHRLAREGKEVERAPRPVTVYRFDVEPVRSEAAASASEAGVSASEAADHSGDSSDDAAGEAGRGAGVWRAEVECSSGTYVRTLAADLGTALGGGAHLGSLCRSAVGSFGLADACALDEPVLLPEAAAVSHLEALTLDAAGARRAAHGQTLDPDEAGAAGDGPWAILGPDGGLLAVYEQRHSRARPLVVLPPA